MESSNNRHHVSILESSDGMLGVAYIDNRQAPIPMRLWNNNNGRRRGYMIRDRDGISGNNRDRSNSDSDDDGGGNGGNSNREGNFDEQERGEDDNTEEDDDNDSEENREKEEDKIGTIVLFPILLCHDTLLPNIIKSYRLTNIRMGHRYSRHDTTRGGGISSSSKWRDTSPLWPVIWVPNNNHQSTSSFDKNDMLLLEKKIKIDDDLNTDSSIREVITSRRSDRAHILLNDEDDGYRMLWIEFGKDVVEHGSGYYGHGGDATSVLDSSNCVVSIPIPGGCESAIETILSDAVTGRRWIPIDPLSNTHQQDSNEKDHSKKDVVTNEDEKEGKVHHNKNGRSNDLPMLIFEAYLHVDVLLRNIILRDIGRTQTIIDDISPTTNYAGDNARNYNCEHSSQVPLFVLPDFYYDLVSVDHSGREITLIIAFRNTVGVGYNIKKGSQLIGNNAVEIDTSLSTILPAASLAVIVSVNPFLGNYFIRGWTSHPQLYQSKFLRSWSSSLASALRQQRRHVSCSQSVGWQKWTGLLPILNGTVISKLGSVNITHVLSEISSTKTEWFKTPLIPSASCHKLATNEAVIACKPVPSIRCKDFPVGLCYG